MDKIPEDHDARLDFLEGWTGQQSRRWAKEQQRRPYAEKIARGVAETRQRIGQVDSLWDVAMTPVVITKPSELPVDRAPVFADLIVRLREYKWASPIVSECDEPRYIAPNAIEVARRHRPDAPWLLYLEDDVILGPDFGLLPGLLREADELFPNTGLVSFFSLRLSEPGWSIHPMKQFGGLQCAAVRNTDYLVGFRAFLDHGVTQSAAKQRSHGLPYLVPDGPLNTPDGALRRFLAVEYDAHALWCPSLVQHADVTSVFLGQRNKRISSSYQAAYG